METLLWKMEAKNGVVYFEDYANGSSFLHHLWKVCLAEYLYVMASIDGFTTFGLPIPGNVMDHLKCIEPTRFWFLQHEQGDFKDLEDLTHIAFGYVLASDPAHKIAYVWHPFPRSPGWRSVLF